MVKSVIGGFQKISKTKKYPEDDFFENKSKKKKKIKRNPSKFDSVSKTTETSYEEGTDNEESYGD